MQVFRLYFNPKIRKNKIIADFVYEPINIEERKLGNLYILGELFNVSPQNFQFLNRLNLTIKKNYYQSQKGKNFIEALKRTNEFLFNQAKTGDVSWLGNLNFLILNLSPKENQTKFDFLFTKTGKIEALLLREDEIIDIGQGSALEQIATYPLKIFKTVISGEFEQGDILLLLSKEIYNYFLKENLLKKFIFLNKEINIIGQKFFKTEDKENKLLDKQEAEFFSMIKSQIKNLIYSKEKELLEVNGICLLIILRETNRRLEEYSQKQALIFEKMVPQHLISQIYFSFNKKIKNLLNLFKKDLTMVFPVLFRKITPLKDPVRKAGDAGFLSKLFRKSLKPFLSLLTGFTSFLTNLSSLRKQYSLIKEKIRFLKLKIRQEGLKLLHLLTSASFKRLLAMFRVATRAIKQFYFNKVKIFSSFSKTHRAKKILSSIVFLIFILLIGYFLFR